MKDKKYHFSEYMDNSKELLKLLFGEELFNKLKRKKLKSVNWEGVDVDCSDITATFPNIKDRFNKDWIDNFKDGDITLLDLYLQTVFHYGYQQCYDHNKKIFDLEELHSLMESLKKENNL